MANISRQGAIELLEFVNDFTIRSKPIKNDPLAARFRDKLGEALAVIAAGDHLSAPQIDLFEEIALRHLAFKPHAYNREALHWTYTPNVPKNNRVPIYSHDVLEIYGAREDDTRRFPGDLRRCQLESCNRFFFLSERREDPTNTRGAPPKYCTEECMLAKNAEGGPERGKRSRATHKEPAN